MFSDCPACAGPVKEFASRPFCAAPARANPRFARGIFGTVDPNKPKTLIVETYAIDYMPTMTFYVPAQSVPGTEVPFMVIHDGPSVGRPDMNFASVLDNLILQQRVPALVAIMISSGGGDAQGHERGREYDTMSGLYAEFIEDEVLTLVGKTHGLGCCACQL